LKFLLLLPSRFLPLFTDILLHGIAAAQRSR
jgi:hypothetical protein